MVLSAVQERLAPWRAWLFPRRVCLEIQDQALTALALEGSTIAWCETLPLPEGVLVKAWPQQAQALGDLIGDWLIERGYPGARLRAVLPWGASGWRRLQWPESAAAQPLGELLPPDLGAEAFGAPLDQLDLCVHPLEGKREALLLGARTDLLEAWIDVLAQAGLALDGLEAAGVCCARVATGAQVPLVLFAEADQCWLLLLSHGVPRWQWRLPGPAQLPDLAAELELALAYARHQDPAVGMSPLGLVLSGACVEQREALLPALEGVASAGVLPIDPVTAGAWSAPAATALNGPTDRLGLLWGLAMAELTP